VILVDKSRIKRKTVLCKQGMKNIKIPACPAYHIMVLV